MDRIPVAGPWITEKEVDAVADAARNGWYQNANTYHQRFEEAFAKHVGVRHAIALPSCTSALHLSLLALGVGPGDEVIVPEITWIATAAPISYVGATPVFADVDERTWCLSPGSLEECITARTRAVIPVDLYGNMHDADAIRAVARRHGVAVIEDAAEAAGGEYHGRRAGSLGDAGVFSFHGSKTLTTGEGGMLVTESDDIRERVLVLRDHGRRPLDPPFWNVEVAYKYKMSALQAALGLAQLDRLAELLARKRRIFEWYSRRLGAIGCMALNHEAAGTSSTFWMVTVVWKSECGMTKDKLGASLAERGIDTRPFFHPLSSLPAYRDSPQARRSQSRNATSYRLAPHGINLPSALSLTEDQVDYVCDVLRGILAT